MKSKKQNPFLAAAITLVGFAFTSSSLHAAALTWQTTTGDWDLSATNWTGGVAWTQTSTSDGSNTATFAGTDGTLLVPHVVTIGATTMAAESITFNSSYYVITGGTLALRPTTTTNGPITVAAGKTATINSAISYSNNVATTITSNAGSVLNLGGGASNAQYTFTGDGTVNMTNGFYQANTGSVNVSTFNQTGGTFSLNQGNTVSYTIGNAAGRDVNYTISGGAVNSNANNGSHTDARFNIGLTTGTNTSTLTLKTGGAVNVGTTAAGQLRIGGNADSNGVLDVQGGTLTVGTNKPLNQIYFFALGADANRSAVMTQSDGTVTTGGIQFGGTTGTYDAASTASLTLSGGDLFVGSLGITRGSAAGALPTTIKLLGGTLGADQAWSSSLDMKLGTTGGGPTIRTQDAASTARNITLSGILSNDTGVNGTLTKTGSGTLTLSGANTFDGGIKIVNGTVNTTTNDTALGGGIVTMGGTGSTGATLTIGRTHANDFTVNAPDSGSNVIAANGGGSNYTLTGGITLNGDLTLQTFNNAISGVTKAGGTLSGGITGTGDLLLNNIGLAANTFNLINTAINHTGSLTLQGTGTGDTTIGASIGSNVTSVTQNSATSRLILSGTSTYTGDTLVNNGTLELTSTGGLSFLIGASGDNNQITGATAGTVSLDGAFSFDLTAAGTAPSDFWNIVDFANLNGSSGFGANFNVVGFNDIGGGLWSKDNGGTTYQFSQGSGLLTVIPEPSAALLGALGMLVFLRRRK